YGFASARQGRRDGRKRTEGSTLYENKCGQDDLADLPVVFYSARNSAMSGGIRVPGRPLLLLQLLFKKLNYPWLPPPDSSRTIEPTKPLASPNSISVLSR